MSRFHPSEFPTLKKKWTQSGQAAVRGLPVSSPAAFVQRQDENRLGLMVVLIGLYLFMHVVPFAELLVVYLHIRIPLVALMWGLVSVMALFTLRLPHFFQSPVAIPWMGLLVMLVLASVFGSYPSYSTSFILGICQPFPCNPAIDLCDCTHYATSSACDLLDDRGPPAGVADLLEVRAVSRWPAFRAGYRLSKS